MKLYIGGLFQPGKNVPAAPVLLFCTVSSCDSVDVGNVPVQRRLMRRWIMTFIHAWQRAVCWRINTTHMRKPYGVVGTVQSLRVNVSATCSDQKHCFERPVIPKNDMTTKYSGLHPFTCQGEKLWLLVFRLCVTWRCRDSFLSLQPVYDSVLSFWTIHNSTFSFCSMQSWWYFNDTVVNQPEGQWNYRTWSFVDIYVGNHTVWSTPVRRSHSIHNSNNNWVHIWREVICDVRGMVYFQFK